MSIPMKAIINPLTHSHDHTFPSLPPPGNVNVDVEEARFKDIMREYETTAKPKYKTGFDPDGKHSVAELWKVIDDAVDKYQSKDVEGVWGRIRLAFRKLGDKDKAIEGWLGLLPQESQYLSVVCGGLKLVLHVNLGQFSHGQDQMLTRHRLRPVCARSHRWCSISSPRSLLSTPARGGCSTSFPTHQTCRRRAERCIRPC